MNMVVICWKIRIFAYWTTPWLGHGRGGEELWFAEKFVSLLIEQHPVWACFISEISCDLLKNSYLCLLNTTTASVITCLSTVVICWKIRIFAYWTTPVSRPALLCRRLWFAEKFVSLLIEQHRSLPNWTQTSCCDLLKNSYLCLLNNTNLWK